MDRYRSTIGTFLRSYVRILLVTCNLYFLITGAAILSVGVMVKQHYKNYNYFLDDKFAYTSDLLILTSLIILVISFFGCCGAAKNNRCMIKTYSSLLIIVLILEIFVGISGIVLKNTAEKVINSTLTTTIQDYGKNNTDITAMWDQMQNNFACCGIDNSTDWEKVNGTNGLIPISCCKIPDGAFGNFTCNAETASLAKEGCATLFKDYVNGNSISVLGVGLSFAIIQFLGIFLSCYLAKHINNDYEAV